MMRRSGWGLLRYCLRCFFEMENTAKPNRQTVLATRSKITYLELRLSMIQTYQARALIRRSFTYTIFEAFVPAILDHCSEILYPLDEKSGQGAI